MPQIEPAQHGGAEYSCRWYGYRAVFDDLWEKADIWMVKLYWRH